jgi:hypothetical protein
MPKHFNQVQRAKVSAMFDQENEYKKHMNNLRTTLLGLSGLLDNRPDLEEVIKPQFDSLNLLYYSLLPDNPTDYPYPPYHNIWEEIDTDIQAIKKQTFINN